MTALPKQTKEWGGSFGREYTDRNAMSLAQMEEMTKSRYGIGKTALNTEFIGSLDRSLRILEAGANIGNQLLCLQQMGFRNLFALELQGYAVRLARSRTQGIEIVQGSLLEMPFGDACFDLVFTSGVLIHISPDDLGTAMHEVCRCSGKYVLGLEYWAPETTEIRYRGKQNMMWKADYARLYVDSCGGLESLKERRLEYVDGDEVDTMFLLEKKT